MRTLSSSGQQMHVAITGGIACGKSTVAGMLSEFGCDVLDTDDVTHRLEDAGGKAVPAIVAAFGAVVQNRDGSINRRELSALVFRSPEKLAKLNAIVHPLVVDEVREWLAAETDASFKAVLVPLLFEANLDLSLKWDAVVAVVCRENEQIRRLIGRGLSEDEAHARIVAQMPCERKAELSDYVIKNDGDLLELRGEIERVVSAILG